MKKLLLFILTVLLSGLNVFADDQLEILKKLESYRIMYNEFSLQVNLTSYRNDRIQETAVFNVYIKGQNRSLVIAQKFRTKDMKMLYADENLWVQLPGARRPVRITPIQRLMGEASNGDVAQLSIINNYDLEITGNEEVNGIKCKRLKLTAKRPSATYNKIILYASENDYLPVKAEYYLISGKHFKTAYFEKYFVVGGKKTLQKMTIHDVIKKGYKTTFEYSDIKENKLPVKYFNKNYLIHIKGL